MLKVFLAYTKDKIAQRFGDNATPLYAAQGLKGHTAYDWDVPWGTAIPNCTPNAYCYSRMNEYATPDKYKGVFFLTQADDGKWYEISYGHLSGFVAEVGKTYQVGETVGYVGNSGDVYVGDHYVTLAEKEAGSHAGEHLHGPQIRPLARVAHKTGRQLIYDEHGPYRDKEGFWYEVLDYGNGYNGCVSLRDFSTETLAIDQLKAADPVQATVAAVAEAVQKLPDVPADKRPYYIQVLTSILKAIQELIHGRANTGGDTGYTLAMDNEPKAFGPFSSSVDPSQLATSVEGFLKTLAGLLVFWGLFTADQNAAFLKTAPELVQTIVVLAPLAFSAWNSAVTVFGLLRKAFVALIGRLHPKA